MYSINVFLVLFVRTICYTLCAPIGGVISYLYNAVMSENITYAIDGSAKSMDWRLFGVSLIEVFFCGYITLTTIVLQFDIASALNFSYLQMIWISLSYTTITTGLVAFAGQVNRLFKHIFWVFIFAALLLLVGTIILSASNGAGTVYTARIIQGVAASILTPASLIITQLACPKKYQPKANLVWIITISLGTLAGCLIGALCALASWRLMYWVTIPFLVLALYLIWPYRNIVAKPQDWRKADYLGMLLLLGSAVILVLLFSTGFEFGWTSSTLINFYAVAPVLLIAFFVYEKYAPNPIFLYRIVKDKTFLISIITSFFIYWVLYSYLFIYTLYTQSILCLQYGFFRSCMSLLPCLIPFVIGAGIVAKLKKYCAKGIIVIAALLLIFIGFIAMFFIYPHAGYIAIWWAQILVGFGIGVVTVIANSTALAAVKAKDAPFASSIYATCLYLGASVGVAVSQMVYIFIYQYLLKIKLAVLSLTASQQAAITDLANKSNAAYQTYQKFLSTLSGAQRAALPHITKQVFTVSFAYCCLLFATLALVLVILLSIYSIEKYRKTISS